MRPIFDERRPRFDERRMGDDEDARLRASMPARDARISCGCKENKNPSSSRLGPRWK
jgi:hypothetical protein